MRSHFQQHTARIKVLIVNTLAHIDILNQTGIYLIGNRFELHGKSLVGRCVLIAPTYQKPNF